MKYLFFFALSLQLLAAEQIQALIIDGFNNHNWKNTTIELRKALENNDEFKVEVSTVTQKDSPQWEDWNPNFTQYDVVIQNMNDIAKNR